MVKETEDLTKKCNIASNKIAASIADLAARVTEDMEESEVDAVKIGLQKEVDRLTEMCKDPASPFPGV